MNQTLNFYKKNNKKLIQQYNSVSFESVHKDWLEYLPSRNSLVIDIGAGTGRDALWLGQQGFQVVAVEPVIEFYENVNIDKATNIKWITDSLPDLKKVEQYHHKASLILLSAVWMHLTADERNKSFARFSKLNKQNGLLVISLRHGESPDERVMHVVSVNELQDLASKNNYRVKDIKQSGDKLKRTDVYWETVILEKY